MVWPSGLTSSEIQVPLVAVNAALRPGTRGSGFCGGPPAPPGGPWAGRGGTKAVMAASLPTHRGGDGGSAVAPRLFRQGTLPRPDLVQAVALVEAAVLHHVADGVGVPQVLQRVFVQHDQVGE